MTIPKSFQQIETSQKDVEQKYRQRLGPFTSQNNVCSLLKITLTANSFSKILAIFKLSEQFAVKVIFNSVLHIFDNLFLYFVSYHLNGVRRFYWFDPLLN